MVEGDVDGGLGGEELERHLGDVDEFLGGGGLQDAGAVAGGVFADGLLDKVGGGVDGGVVDEGGGGYAVGSSADVEGVGGGFGAEEALDELGALVGGREEETSAVRVTDQVGFPDLLEELAHGFSHVDFFEGVVGWDGLLGGEELIENGVPLFAFPGPLVVQLRLWVQVWELLGSGEELGGGRGGGCDVGLLVG